MRINSTFSIFPHSLRLHLPFFIGAKLDVATGGQCAERKWQWRERESFYFPHWPTGTPMAKQNKTGNKLLKNTPFLSNRRPNKSFLTGRKPGYTCRHMWNIVCNIILSGVNLHLVTPVWCHLECLGIIIWNPEICRHLDIFATEHSHNWFNEWGNETQNWKYCIWLNYKLQYSLGWSHRS